MKETFFGEIKVLLFIPLENCRFFLNGTKTSSSKFFLKQRRIQFKLLVTLYRISLILFHDKDDLRY